MSIEDLRRLARRRLPRGAFDFFDGGAEDEVTLGANRAAFQRVRLLPRVLSDVSDVDTSATMLGATTPLPIAVAPTGAAGFGWPRADVAIARAAAAAGIPYTLATPATASIERIAREAGGRLWFQIYPLRDPQFTMHLVDRAAAAGYEALIVTVDLPVGGKRERDYRNDFAVPFHFTPRNVRAFAARPGWALGMLVRGIPPLENLIGFESADTRATALASSVGRSYDPSFDWDGLARIRDAWPGRLVLKGIVRPDDAERAASAGVDGIVVSNHGGRQLDGGIASLDALPGVVTAVSGRCEVLVDSGVRRGSDVLKALALGASGVLVGRATLYGACAAGEAGAARAIDILADELRRTMQLCGVDHLRDVPARDLVARGPQDERRVPDT